jgi:hypothetical protein
MIVERLGACTMPVENALSPHAFFGNLSMFGVLALVSP